MNRFELSNRTVRLANSRINPNIIIIDTFRAVEIGRSKTFHTPSIT